MNNIKLVLQVVPEVSSSNSGILSNPLLSKDIWRTSEDLNLKINQHGPNWTFNFTSFKQEWFKKLVKIYILIQVGQKYAVNTLRVNLTGLKKFDSFLSSKSISSVKFINNQLFDEYEYELKTQGLKQISIEILLGSLAKFFDICRREKLLDINTYWFQGKRKMYHPNNQEINYIPESVWNQLDQNLHCLPEPLQRMVILIRSLGLRIGELCNLPFDCLIKHNGQWRLRLVTEKYDIEDEIPLASPDLVAVIKEQQDYIRSYFVDEYDKLFCANKAVRPRGTNKLTQLMDFEPSPKVMSAISFNYWLNRLAKTSNICTQDGEIWHFTSHQFRRTVATIMTNAKVRDLIIQKYLRHRSPQMLDYYRHLMKQVIASEMQDIMKSKEYVDITGKIVCAYRASNLLTEVVRQRMNQITTQYGECHRPNINNPCPIINAYWSCNYWRCSVSDLPFLQSDLKLVESELEIATKLGMVRQQQGLSNNQNNLLKIIQGLSGDTYGN